MKSLKNVLIVSPYGLGDLLFITPIMRALRLMPTVQRVDLLLGSRSDVVVKNNPHINDIYKVDKDALAELSRKEFMREIFSLGKKLKNKKYDLMLDFSLRGEYAFFGQFFLGIPRRAGFEYKRRGFFHNIRKPLQKGFSQKHVTEFYCELAQAAGIPVEDRYLEFYLNSRDILKIPELSYVIKEEKEYEAILLLVQAVASLGVKTLISRDGRLIISRILLTS